MAAVLETADLSRTFGAVVAAADITISIGEQEVVGIIGANGAGKTTFINMVTGYLPPTAGRICYLGRDITARPPREITRLGIRRSFQIPQIFGGLTVFDNLLIALGIARPSGDRVWHPLATTERTDAASGILDRFGIGDYRDQPAGMLPQGVRKLLDIAMAMVGDPRLLLLDEPTSGISVDEKFAVMDTIMAVLARHRVTVLFVEHDMEIVERYALRVAAFYDGRIIADGAPTEVLADADVRQLIVGSETQRRRPAAGSG